MTTRQPNILVMMADQLTPFALGCYGNEAVHSPQIDQLAREGVQFDSAYCSSPLCTPARYAFMTGQNVSRYAGYDNAAYLPSNIPTFAHYLRASGYQTCLSGKMHFVGADQLHGFEHRLTTDIYPADFGWVPDWNMDPDQRIDLWYHNMSSVKQSGVAAISNQLAYDDEVGSQTLRALYDYSRSTDDRPWCLVSSFIHPHDPYATRQRYWDLYDDVVLPLPRIPRPSPQDNDLHSLRLERAIAVDATEITETDILRARRAYFGNISYLDEWLGRIRTTLAECGFADNTVIILISDHGDMLGERGLWYKMSFYEWSVRVPLLVHYPRRFKPSRIKSPVAQTDITPTLMDLAGSKIDPVDPLDGRSLLPCLEGGELDDPVALSEYLAEGAISPMLMVRKDHYKYTCSGSDPEQLFDLDGDPDETNNLAENNAHSALINEFRAIESGHWDRDKLHRDVIEDQRRRRFLGGCLRQGQYTSWDFQPSRSAADEYTRSHHELTELDFESRWPRVDPYVPDWR